MPRIVQMVALVLAFLVSGAPAWISELAEDDCAEGCADESSRPDEGCGDCSIVCSSCPRRHVLMPALGAIAPAVTNIAWLSTEAAQRVPDDPVADGVFHPPRLVAG